jgi:hypothetical protein
LPNENLVGIRVGQGSNNGVHNYIKHCSSMYCAKGVSVCGEHYIFEDVLTHHCAVGFAFGDILTAPNYEHPNIMIGCSIEGCKRLMTLNKYGAAPSTTDHATNTLICIGLSTEVSWAEPGVGNATTLPILEVVKGQYRGRIEADYGGYSANVFENDGSGVHMTQVSY